MGWGKAKMIMLLIFLYISSNMLLFLMLTLASYMYSLTIYIQLSIINNDGTDFKDWAFFIFLLNIYSFTGHRNILLKKGNTT